MQRQRRKLTVEEVAIELRRKDGGACERSRESLAGRPA